MWVMAIAEKKVKTSDFDLRPSAPKAPALQFETVG